MQANCTAGSLLTIVGSGFSTNLSAIFGLAIYTAYVPIAIVSSTDTEVVFVAPEPLAGSAGNPRATYYMALDSECQIDQSVWQMYWYAADSSSSRDTAANSDQHRHRSSSSDSGEGEEAAALDVPYYPFPAITSISGCTDVGSGTHNCTAGATITITGSGFGCDNSIVFFQGGGHGYYCSDVRAVGRNVLTGTLPQLYNNYKFPDVLTLSVFSHGDWSNQAPLLWYSTYQPPPPPPNATSTADERA